MINVKYYNEISSTNTVLKQMALEGCPSGTALVAFSQTEGRGRRGKTFSSPKNGLYISLLVRLNMPFEKALYLTTATSVAVQKSLLELCNVETKIKWVNDLYKNDKKVCGILVEASPIKNGLIEWAIIGVGINIAKPQNDFSPDIKDIATSVFEYEIDKPKLKFIAENVIENIWNIVNSGDEESVYNSYCKNNLCIGRMVKVLSKEPYMAKVLCIDRDYHLIVEDEQKQIHELSSGEISIKL